MWGILVPRTDVGPPPAVFPVVMQGDSAGWKGQEGGAIAWSEGYARPRFAPGCCQRGRRSRLRKDAARNGLGRGLAGNSQSPVCRGRSPPGRRRTISRLTSFDRLAGGVDPAPAVLLTQLPGKIAVLRGSAPRRHTGRRGCRCLRRVSDAARGADRESSSGRRFVKRGWPEATQAAGPREPTAHWPRTSHGKRD